VSVDRIERLLDGRGLLPRGKALRDLAEVLGCSISYLVGLEPDEPPPPELLQEDQGTLGPLLSGDQDALLRAYNRLDVASKAALLLVAQKMAGPEPAEPPPAGSRRQAAGSPGQGRNTPTRRPTSKKERA
jgi:hypothetical protein